jgi:hypothetical protein
MGLGDEKETTLAYTGVKCTFVVEKEKKGYMGSTA